jgi:AraC-like DNA-binding protein
METMVSLLNAALLAIAILGCLMFIITPAYRGVCLLLGLVSLAAIINLLEDFNISRELHLISPVFVLGYGPAFYFATKRLIAGPIGYYPLLHFLPMLLLLPFTAHTQTVIALGTLWRVGYALATLKLIIEFNRQLSLQRSDASEVSLTWLAGLVGVSTLFSAVDLVRLNFQLEIGPTWNTIGYTASAGIFFVVLLLLILILNYRRAGLETIADSTARTPSPEIKQFDPQPSAHTKKDEESAADYQSLFTFLDGQIAAQKWYSLPRLTLNQLSDLSGMSTRDISRSINLVAGVSFNDYINQLRIEQIKQTLEKNNAERGSEDKLNLTNLALSAGFSSKATFNQTFKKATGMTPSEYRRTKASQQIQNHDSGHLVSGD